MEPPFDPTRRRKSPLESVGGLQAPLTRGHRLMITQRIPDPEGSILRVWNRGEKAVVGIGFLIPNGQVATCAHVVVEALGLPADVGFLPRESVSLDFPLLASGRSVEHVRATVVEAHVGIDVALLELDGEVPEGARPLRFAEVEGVSGFSFEAFGCPYSRPPAQAFTFFGLGPSPKREQYLGGVWAWGKLRRRQGNNWLQCDQDERMTYRVQGGFSGGPIWVPHLQLAVAVVARYDATDTGRAAFGIPMADVFRAFPHLRAYQSQPLHSDGDVGALLAEAALRIRGLASREACEIASQHEFASVKRQVLSVAEGVPSAGTPRFSRTLARALRLLEQRLLWRLEAIERELSPLNERLNELRALLERWPGPGSPNHKNGIKKA